MAVTRISRGFAGLSTDTRPKLSNAQLSPRSAGYVPPPQNGDRFVETDTGEVFVHVGNDYWERMP